MNTKHEIAAYLNTEIQKLFPNNGFIAAVKNILGDIVMVQYTKGKDKTEWSNGICQNDPAFMRVIIQNDKAGFYIDGTKLGPVKFRKISGKTEQEVAEKLVAWFVKNFEAIYAI